MIEVTSTSNDAVGNKRLIITGKQLHVHCINTACMQICNPSEYPPLQTLIFNETDLIKLETSNNETSARCIHTYITHSNHNIGSVPFQFTPAFLHLCQAR